MVATWERSGVGFADMRAFIEACQSVDAWRAVDGIDWNLELSALTEATAELIPEPPLLLFELRSLRVDVFLPRPQLQKTQVVVGEPLGELGHRLDVALLLAEQIELDQRIGGRLRAERGDLRIVRLAVLAVAGETRRHALLKRFRARRNERDAEQRQGDQQRAHACLY